MLKISIVTVCYNSGSTIKDAIESVIGQDYPNIEYIIVDGGSKDGTKSIIESYSQHINKYISEPDGGLYDAINKGIRLATGDVVGILNSDDFFASNKSISKVVEIFQSGSAEIVFADIDFIDTLNTTKIVRHYSSKFFKPWMFRMGFQPAHPTFYTFRKNFERYGFYRTDLKIAGDFELLLRYILKHKLSYCYLNETLVKMRIGGVSTSGIKSMVKLNSEMVVSCRDNKIYTNNILIYSKYLIKWWGFVFKK